MTVLLCPLTSQSGSVTGSASSLAPTDDEPDSVRLESGVKGTDNGLKEGNVDAPADAGEAVAGTDDTDGTPLAGATLDGAPPPAFALPGDAPPAPWPGGVPPTPKPGALPDFPWACTPLTIKHAKTARYKCFMTRTSKRAPK